MRHQYSSLRVKVHFVILSVYSITTVADQINGLYDYLSFDFRCNRLPTPVFFPYNPIGASQVW